MDDLVPVSLEGVAQGGLVVALNEAIGDVAAHLMAQRGLGEARVVSMKLAFVPDKSGESISIDYKVEVKVPSERRGSSVAIPSRHGFVGVVAPPVQTDLEEHVNVVRMQAGGE